MSKRIPFVDGDEQDAFTKARHLYKWRHGYLKWVKRKYNKRFRRAWRHE